MRILTVQSAELAGQDRLDAHFHLSDGRRFARRVGEGSIAHLQLGAISGINAGVWAPPRFKRIYAVSGERSAPYLRPSDTLNYFPRAADYLSATRSRNIDQYRLHAGMILVTCSGRNLGPAVYVDAFLERFLLSHDMVRVEIDDETKRFYILALLGTQVGQQLLRKDKSGSVIDHITVEHVAALDLPILRDDILGYAAEKMRRATKLCEEARLALTDARSKYEKTLPAISGLRSKALGWSIWSRQLADRLDAAPYEPDIRQIRKLLLKCGGKPLRETATPAKPAGRYKTIYVGSAHGVPILSGAQLLQMKPLNLKYIAKRALHGSERYRVKSGWVIYQADGRSEEALGEPVMVTPDRDNWLASGHVGRLIPKEGISSGGLYLAFESEHAQRQLKALASGSVVDATFPADAEAIVLPPLSDTLGKLVEDAWSKFSEVQRIEHEAFQLIETHLPLA